ncbi:MAG: hypothetical protein AAB539_04230, partial [Patescibacteria group bacterium]
WLESKNVTAGETAIEFPSLQYVERQDGVETERTYALPGATLKRREIRVDVDVVPRVIRIGDRVVYTLSVTKLKSLVFWTGKSDQLSGELQRLEQDEEFIKEEALGRYAFGGYWKTIAFEKHHVDLGTAIRSDFRFTIALYGKPLEAVIPSPWLLYFQTARREKGRTDIVPLTLKPDNVSLTYQPMVSGRGQFMGPKGVIPARPKFRSYITGSGIGLTAIGVLLCAFGLARSVFPSILMRSRLQTLVYKTRKAFIAALTGADGKNADIGAAGALYQAWQNYIGVRTEGRLVPLSPAMRAGEAETMSEEVNDALDALEYMLAAEAVDRVDLQAVVVVGQRFLKESSLRVAGGARNGI